MQKKGLFSKRFSILLVVIIIAIMATNTIVFASQDNVPGQIIPGYYSNDELQQNHDTAKQSEQETPRHSSLPAGYPMIAGVLLFPLVLGLDATVYCPIKLLGATGERNISVNIGRENWNPDINNTSLNLSFGGLNDSGIGYSLGGTMAWFDKMIPGSNGYPCPGSNWTDQGWHYDNPVFGFDVKIFVPPVIPNKNVSLYFGGEMLFPEQIDIQKDNESGDLYQNGSRRATMSGYEYGVAYRNGGFILTAGNSSLRGINFSLGVTFGSY